MLKYRAKDRLSIEEVMNHEWFNGPVPTDEEILAEFSQRY